MFRIQSQDRIIHKHNFLNPLNPCTYEYIVDKFGIQGEFVKQLTVEYFNPLSVNSLYSSLKYSGNYPTNYFIAFPQSNGQYTKTNTFLGDDSAGSITLDSSVNQNYFTICELNNFGSNNDLFHNSLVKNEFKYAIFDFGSSKNIATFQDAIGSSYLDIISSAVSGRIRNITTIISDQIYDVNSQMFYIDFDDNYSDGTLWFPGEGKNRNSLRYTWKSYGDNIYAANNNNADYTHYMPQITYDYNVHDYSYLDLGQQVYLLISSSTSYDGKIYFLKYQYDGKIEFRSFYRNR